MASIRAVCADPGVVDIPVGCLAALMQDAGTGRFIDSLLAFCRASVGADFVSVFTLGGAGGPELLGTATTTGAENTRRAAEGYRRHYASDVNFGLMSRRSAGAYITYQTARDISSKNYRSACYDMTGIADRLSYLRITSDLSLSVSVYRSLGRGRFSDTELDRASALMPLLVAGVDLHEKASSNCAAVTTITDAERALQSCFPGLSKRECEVAARAKMGLSARQIGADLAIAETTVISHRKAAYVRMGLKSLRELISL
jgi:DNA-binding CsgD family transcriptional regulator